MKNLFNNLTRRYQTLVIFMMVSVLCFTLFLLKNFLNVLYETSTQNVTQAKYLLTEVQRTISINSSTSKLAKIKRTSSLSSIANKQANIHNVVIDRVEEDNDGNTILSINEVKFTHFYAWLNSLEKEEGVRVIKTSIRRNQLSTGKKYLTIRAQLVLSSN
jgi:type II secretory pathway component PulM